MKANSMTVTLARVARDVDRWHNGMIAKDRLLVLLNEYSVHQEAETYLVKMVNTGWMYFDPITDLYHLTTAATQTVVIPVRVPRLNAKEIRNDIVQQYARYGGIIDVGEVDYRG